MGAPTVTVIIPTRDRWSLAARAARSALHQQEVATDVIVVDDGSVEPPPHQGPLSSDRVKLVRHAVSRGLSAARNRGLAEARADWVAFLDDDDLWAPDKLRRQLRAAEDARAEFVYCAACLVDVDLRIREFDMGASVEALPTALLERNVIPATGSSILVRREVMSRHGGFDEAFHQLADWDLGLRLSEGVAIAAVDSPLVAYTRHANNMAATSSQRLLPEWRRLRRKHRALARRRGGRLRRDSLIRWYVQQLQLGGRRWRAAVTGTVWGLLLRNEKLLREATSGIRGDSAGVLPPPAGPLPWVDVTFLTGDEQNGRSQPGGLNGVRNQAVTSGVTSEPIDSPERQAQLGEPPEQQFRRLRSWAAAARGIERSRSWRIGSDLVRAFRLLAFRRPATPHGPAELAASIEEHLETARVHPGMADRGEQQRRKDASWAAAARGIENSRSWRIGSYLVRAFRLIAFRRPATPHGPAELAASIEEHLEIAKAEPKIAASIESSDQDRGRSMDVVESGEVRALLTAIQRPPKAVRRHVERWRTRRRVLRPTILGPHPLTPVSREFGFDRGKPIDRYYIEDFLRRHGDYSGYSEGDIKGDVMEVGGDDYTRRFGGANVSSVDVLHASAANPAATLIGDLATGEGIPSERYDCIICTQTLHLVYGIHGAVETLHRALKPGGVLLATLPGITQSTPPDRDHLGDYWRLTSRSARRLFGERFQPSEVLVEAYGNLASATGFLHGLVIEDLRADELDARDPDYELLIAVRARRSG